MAQNNNKNICQQKEASIEINDAQLLQNLSGPHSANLKEIERALNLKIGRNSNYLVIQGADVDVDLAEDLISQMINLIKSGETFFSGDVRRCIKILSNNKDTNLAEYFRDKIQIAGRKKSIVPKTFKQKEYLEKIKTQDIVFGIGPAGTGKTYLAMAMAISALLSKEVKRVILCRPAVEAGEKLGFLPGDMAEKVNPYLRPLYDALHDMVDFEKTKELLDRGLIEVAPLAFMRGRTLSNAFVILDEAQNTTSVQMKMFLTRLGKGAKCVITGDITQIDLPKGVSSGLKDAINILRNIPEIEVVEFTEEDVIRHPLVAKIVDAYTAKKT